MVSFIKYIVHTRNFCFIAKYGDVLLLESYNLHPDSML